MGKESITQKQGIVMMVTFILGSSLVLGTGAEAKHDVWIAILIAILMAIPIFFVYARLLSIFPGKGLYEILDDVFGKVLGKIIALPFIWFAFHMGSLVIRNFTEFITTVSIPETPQYIIAIFMTLLCIWGVNAGIEVIGRWSSIILPVLIILIIAVTFLFAPMLEFRNLKPVLYDGLKPVLDSAFSVFAFPLAETVIFTMILNNLRNNSNSYKIYYYSLLLGGLIILLVSVRSLIVLGVANISIMYFPSYSSVRLINIGDFLQRIEVSVTVVFLFAGFVKINMCLYVASDGLARVLNIRNYRQIVAPVGLLMMLLANIIYRNSMEMFEWANKIYKYYAFPFEIILPLIILLAAEFKVRQVRSKTTV
jgi:spore germination protein KB